MKYAIYLPMDNCPGGAKKVAVLETWDDTVKKAPDSWYWAIGETVVSVLKWAETRGYKWRVRV